MKKTTLALICATFAFQCATAQTIVRFCSEGGQPMSDAKAATTFLQSKLALEEGNEFLDNGVYLRDSLIRETSEFTDELGITHYRLNQYYKGIPVENGVIKIHTEKGNIVFANGEYYRCKNINTNPAFDENTAIEYALQHVQKLLSLNAEVPTLVVESSPKLVLCKNRKDISDTTLHLCYMVGVFAKIGTYQENIYIDAKNGETIGSVSNYDDYNGRAETRYNGVQTIKTSYWHIWDGLWYELQDEPRKITTMNLRNYDDWTYSPYWIHFTDWWDNDWDSDYDNEDKDNGALDAHWGLERTYDYFKEVHGRTSFDNEGYEIEAYVHWGKNYANARWDWRGALLFGDGNDQYDIHTSLDIVAHEFGHAVFQFTVGFADSGEPKALNEGLSDIWGACVEDWATTGKQTWQMGEDIGTPRRVMSTPSTYNDNNWNPNADQHDNSRVLTYWFYLLAHGGSGVNSFGVHYNVTGIGMEKAAKIVYRAESAYMTPNTTYPLMCSYTIRAAQDLSSGQELASTIEAWRAVGLIPDLYTRDNIYDDGHEPIQYLTAGYDNSPDIWLRRHADEGTAHQIAKHNSTNYVYVNVHNRGVAYHYPYDLLNLLGLDNRVEVYVKKAGLSVNEWPNGWTKIGSTSIPSFAPGESQTLCIEGTFPSVEGSNPYNPYALPEGKRVDYAMLTRIVSSKDKMAFTETSNTMLNVINNNNISYKNVVVSSGFFIDDILQQVAAFDIDNIDHPNLTANLHFTSPSNKNGQNLFDEAEIRLSFDKDLLNLWIDKGMEKEGLEQIDDTTFLVVSPEASINNALIPENYYSYMRVHINFLTPEYNEESAYEYHVSLQDVEDKERMGDVTVMVYKDPKDVPFEEEDGERIEEEDAEAIEEEAQYNWYNANGNIEFIAPNPANMQATVHYNLPEEIGNATIVIANTMGLILYSAPIDVNTTSHTINLQSIPTGQYTVRIESHGTIIDSKTLLVY